MKLTHPFLAVIAATLLLSSASSLADGHVSIFGTLEDDLVLESGVTYLVSGDVTVPMGITVTMAPGAILKTDRNLIVYGELHVQGTESQKAYITHRGDDSIGVPISSTGNGEIRIFSDSESSVRHAEVRNTRFIVASSPVIFSHVHFAPTTSNYAGAIHGDLSPDIVVENVTFSTSLQNRGYRVVSRFVVDDFDGMPNLGIPYIIYSDIEVSANATLHIEAGTLVKMRGRLHIHGSLQAQGLASKPIVFAGPNDNRYGFVNPNTSGSFLGFYFHPSSFASILEKSIVAYTSASATAVIIDGSHPYISDARIKALSRNTGNTQQLVSVNGEGQPTLTCLAFSSSASDYWALQNHNSVATVDALDVYWDDPLGPTLPGGPTAGAKVSDNVNVEPFRTSIDAECAIDAPSNLLLDIDGDGEINPVIDGILVSRFMAGLRGEDLTEGLVIDGGAARRTAEEIEGYLHWITTRSAR